MREDLVLQFDLGVFLEVSLHQMVYSDTTTASPY